MILSVKMSKVTVCWSFFFLFDLVLCQDISFPFDSEYSNSAINPRFKTSTYTPSTTVLTRRPTERLKPVVNREKCPGNQLYYPGEPWFCDCGPKYIYYKPTDQCYRVYMKGPCSEGQHLIVKNREVQCVRNPCSEGYVRYNGKCYELEKSDGPCGEINGAAALLKINANTLNVECTEAGADTLTLFSFPERCPPGSKRDAQNKCRENWNVD
ncbi:uncharacterized protein LOC123313881 [Coccinella septempunctata]|uniref:uncharacterized protein LOC123313881 n=1 Tax=Coccinella septempunctata TaxID=41139 RepID=UPI001D062B4E|nr:uncharacterized protein LOC123313881 [Coccinella septempunctata]